ncbi:MAG: hypothetical protein Fur0018_13190 [Anaerolineales bacterium]
MEKWFFPPRRWLLILLSLAGMLFGSTVRAQQSSAPVYHKVIAPSGALTGVPGVTLWQDYGTFALYRVQDARTLAALPASVHPADDIDRILIDAYPFDTQRDTLNLPAALRVDVPRGGALHLVQFVGPIKDAWLAKVRAAGATPIHYIANNAYLVWADDAGRSKLSSMAADKDFVQYSAPYQPYFKLSPTIRSRVLSPAADGDEIVPIVLQVYPHDGWQETAETVKRLAVGTHSDWTPVLSYLNIAVDVRAGDLLTLARRPDVTWMEERLPRQRYDEIQNQLLAAHFNADQSGPSAPGYLTWLDSMGFSQNPADYPVVDITDDGIGDGTVNAGDPTMHQFGNIANPSRLAYVSNCTSASDGGGPDGHGHINTSIVGGYDVRGGFPFQDPTGFQRGMGVSPYGRMAGTRIFGPAGYDISACGNTDQGVILHSYTFRAQISSNSWGCSSCAGTYNSSSQAYDAGTRDADPGTPGNQELLFVFAAGNSGPSSATVGSPGNGKNMVTVGASENYRPSDEDGAWTDGCGIGPTGADNAMDVINFSSRGPAPGGRVKPEVIAPGTHIQGTASTNANYNGSSVCDMYRPSGQTTFAASSGTSHSTPAIAGVSSLYWYWLQHTYNVATPSPALIKAYLIAHTTYLTGVDGSDTLPSNNQGYGMPDMSTAFDSTPRYMLNQSVVLDNSGDTWTFHGLVADPSKPVRIVLVYTDKAGLTGTSPQVNDLNLQAVVNGVTYLGNVFSGQWSTTGGAPDSANNYEAVFLPAGTSGPLDITVTGFNIADDGVPNYGDTTDQDFALVCYNCAQSRDFTLGVLPLSQAVCAPADAAYNVQIGSVLGYTYAVTLSASGIPTGTTALFSTNPVIPPGSSTLTITNTGAAAYGSYAVEVMGVAPTSTHTATVTLDLYTAVPAAATLITPTNGATGVSLTPLFQWSVPAQGAAYDLEIATDPAFTTLVYTATGLTSPAYSLGAPLQTSTTYYWRVRAANACGDGAYTPAFHFRTLAAPGDCDLSQIPNVVYSTDFESGTSGWAHGANVGTDTWVLSSARTHSGSNAFFASGLSTANDQWLTTPPLTLPAGQFPLTLQFWNYQSIEDSITGCYDGALLEVSTDGGATWTQVLSPTLLTDPYDGAIATSFSNPLAGKDAWCGDPQDWLNSVVDLSAYAGQTVQLRFRSGNDSSVAHEGWYIDDVRVQSCMAASYNAALGDSALTAGSPAVVTHTLVLQNLGLADAYTLTLTSGGWSAALLTASPISVTTSGAAAIQVRVTVPDIAPALALSDTFTVTAHSTHSPTLVLHGMGTTTARLTPAVVWGGDSARSGGPSKTVTHTFSLQNTGNHTDTFTLSLSGNAWSTSAPGSIGPLAPGETASVPVQVTIPAAPSLQGMVIATDVFTLTATSTLNSAVSAAAHGTTNALVNPAVQMHLTPNQSGAPGQVVTYTAVVTNTGDYTDTFDLYLSGAAWTTDLDTTVLGPLSAGQSAAAIVTVHLPAQFTALQDAFTLKAVSRLDTTVTAQATRTTSIQATFGVEVSPASMQGFGRPGETVTYTLSVTNTGSVTDTFSIALQGNFWRVTVPTDIIIPAGAGGSLKIAVKIPLGAAEGATDNVTITLRSGYAPTVTAQTTLTTSVQTTKFIYLPLILR